MENANRKPFNSKKSTVEKYRASDQNSVPENPKKLTENEIKYSYFPLWLKLLFGLIICSFFTILAVKRSFDDVVEYNAQGQPQLKPERIAKLERDLNQVENCEQYVILITQSGWYPCFSCVDTAWVYLNAREVYRYGERCDRNDPRYSDSKMTIQNLVLLPEFYGDKTACYQEQQRKIYNYPLLPENLARAKPLGHPPGNKQDR